MSVKPLSLICITSILNTIYSLKAVQFMEDLAVMKALNHSGSFGKHFAKFKKKTKMLFTYISFRFAIRLWYNFRITR